MCGYCNGFGGFGFLLSTLHGKASLRNRDRAGNTAEHQGAHRELEPVTNDLDASLSLSLYLSAEIPPACVRVGWLCGLNGRLLLMNLGTALRQGTLSCSSVARSILSSAVQEVCVSSRGSLKVAVHVLTCGMS